MEVIVVEGPAGGPTIQVEVDGVPDSGGAVYREARGGAGRRVIRATHDLFGEGLALARACAARVAGTLDEIARESGPDELTLQLAIKLDSEVGAVVAKASAGAQLQVTIKWTFAAQTGERPRAG